MTPKLLALGAFAAALAPASASAAYYYPSSSTSTSTSTTTRTADAASAAATVASCAATSITQAFRAFGDTANYFLAPGGDFESTAPGWTLKNARIVSENETAGVRTGRRSIHVGVSRYAGSAEVISPEFCVSADHPTFRFVTRGNGYSRYQAITTKLYYRTLANPSVRKVEESDWAWQYSKRWSPSAINPLATQIPAADLRAGVLVRLAFIVTDNTVDNGGVLIDNVFIDPYRRV